MVHDLPLRLLACDGGPHLLLPEAESGLWRGADQFKDDLDETTDYGRACLAVGDVEMALLSVGKGEALVLQDPPLSGMIALPTGHGCILVFDEWTSVELNPLLQTAISTLGEQDYHPTGLRWRNNSEAVLLFASVDRITEPIYDVFRHPLAPGEYDLHRGEYDRDLGALRLWRLVPRKT